MERNMDRPNQECLQLVLLALKVFLARATGSLGVLSKALHSGLDLIAAMPKLRLVCYLALRLRVPQ